MLFLKGYKIFVHEPGTKPDLNRSGNLLSASTESNILIKQVVKKPLVCIKNDSTDNSTGDSRSENKTDPTPCFIFEYFLSTSHANYPSKFYKIFVENFNRFNGTKNKELDLAVNVFYDEMAVYLLEEKKTQTNEELFADIGN